MAFVVRLFILKRFVNKAPLMDKAKRQFFYEYALILFVGLWMLSLNSLFFSVPFFLNGGGFFIGFIAFGFFIAVDMSLAKEREVIDSAMKESHILKVPKKFIPLTRKFFMVAIVAILIIMIIVMLIIRRDLSWLSNMDLFQMNVMMEMTTATIFKELSFVLLVLLLLVTNILYSYSKNLKILFQTETNVLRGISRGDLSKLIPVATRDEFGIIATYTNKMIYGLRDRIRMLTRLDVAKKIQESFLPNKAPEMPGIEISGTSIYCEEVGGDYFDFFEFSEKKIGIAVTDSAGHGIGSGLYMTTIRAFLRYGASRNYNGPLDLISSVNKYLTRDSYESGMFTTVFFVEIDLGNHLIKWIRSGHEPALLFQPGTGEFQRLLGEGMALGVDADAKIDEHEINIWEKGSVLVIFSDGLKESRNLAGEMYGEKRIKNAIEKYAALPSKMIEKKLLEDFNNFCENSHVEDDITIVVVKLL